MQNGKRKFNYADGCGGKGLLLYNCKIYFLWACEIQFWTSIYVFVKLRKDSTESGAIGLNLFSLCVNPLKPS